MSGPQARVQTPAPAAAGRADRAGARRDGPIFVTGADRSGTTLLFAILASHPDIAMVRRTNLWRYFHGRYGRLDDPINLERALDEMFRYQRIDRLAPDRSRILEDFRSGPPTYGNLFSLFHRHRAGADGRARWGDKSLHSEYYAARIFDEFPDATVIHMLRDPRDRYASVRRRHGRDQAKVAAAMGRWLASARAGRRNERRFAGAYLVLRYEDLVREPEATMRTVCGLVGVPYASAMLSMGGASEHREAGGNSSFGDLEPGTISHKGLGRYRSVLAPREVAFIQAIARRAMAAAGYERAGVGMSVSDRARFVAWDLPWHGFEVTGWRIRAAIQRRRGIRIPSARLVDPTEGG